MTAGPCQSTLERLAQSSDREGDDPMRGTAPAGLGVARALDTG